MPSSRSLFVVLLVAATSAVLTLAAAPGAKANHLTPAMARAILLAGMEHEMDGVATAVRLFVDGVAGWCMCGVVYSVGM